MSQLAPFLAFALVPWCVVAATVAAIAWARGGGHSEAVARWLQQTIEALLYPAFADTRLPVTRAQFTRHGDIASGAREEVAAAGAKIVLGWEDFLVPFVLNMPPGFNDRPIGVFSTFFPARAARAALDGRAAPGKPWAEQRGDREASSACLAWSETWVKPR